MTLNSIQDKRTSIRLLKAYHGDCFIIKTFDKDGNDFNILIDGGPANTYKFSLKHELSNLDTINLLILTHIDCDHIDGLIKFLHSEEFDRIEICEYWYNSKKLLKVSSSSAIGYAEGTELYKLLELKEDKKKWDRIIHFDKTEVNKNGVRINVLSPTIEILNILEEKWDELSKNKEEENNGNISHQTSSQKPLMPLDELAKKKFKPQKSKEDDCINSSSIAILLETLDTSILLLGDSRAEIVLESLKDLGFNENKKLKVNYLKISHHGSKNNTCNDLLDIIETENYIISTNGGVASSKHPSRETIARIVARPNRDLNKSINIIFNYPLQEVYEKIGWEITVDELKKYNFTLLDDIEELPISR